MKITKKNGGGGFRDWGVRVDAERRIEDFAKIQKKNWGGGGQGGLGGGGSGWM